MDSKIKIVGELEFRILNKQGILKRIYSNPLDSYVRAFTQHLYAVFSQLSQNILDISNVSRSFSPPNYIYVNGPDANQNYGIVVGTGTTVVSISDYKLATQIPHGNGAGQLYHAVTTFTPPQTVGSVCSFAINRNFVNNSGADITVKEAGLYGRHNASLWYFCLIRDLTGDIVVANTQTLAATYTLKVTV